MSKHVFAHAEPVRDSAPALRFERLIADVALRFVNIEPEQVDEAIVDCQRQIVEALDFDRCALWIGEGDNLVFSKYVWTRPGCGVPLPGMSAREHFPGILEQLRAGNTVTIESVDVVPPGPDRQSLLRLRTKSTATVPLISGGQLLGALAFGSIRAERTWPRPLLDRLTMIGYVFTQALARRQGHERLQTALAEVSRLKDLLAHDNEVLHREIKALRPVGALAAESPAIQRVLEHVRQVAPTTATVLLLGETGAGKELIAHEIHARSPRGKRPMVRVNCGAIPTSLVESELFGRERGAFTGAVSRQVGRFEIADGSTIFLDEIGELPVESQVKLLRVLQDRVIERLGSTQPIKVDVRVIAATNRNLEEAVAAKTFREDLFYRLNVFPIRVPPLRERPEDIPVLVWSFVEEFSKAFGKAVTSISRDNMEALQRYPWPGNIRELRNVIEYAVIVADSPRLSIELPKPRSAAMQKSVRLADVEAQHIRAVLESTGWRVRGARGAAELLGMKPTTLEGRMAKLGVKRAARP